MLVYISGKYSGANDDEISANIEIARQTAVLVWEHGHVAICPHLNTFHFERDCHVAYDDYIRGDLKILARCDAILMLPDWQQSKGASKERDYAMKVGIPVCESPAIPTLHPTEQRQPIQCEAFLNTVMTMYRVHLAKNADYSPSNVLGPGEIGVVVRLWHKIARLMSLTGFRFTISSSSFEMPREPKNESIEDTLIDAANYAVIGRLLRQGTWGR